MELLSKSNKQSNIEVSVNKKQKIEKPLQGKINVKPGHSIFEVNKTTLKIAKVKLKSVNAVFGADIPNNELDMNDDCVYIPALNADNAKKKFLKK